MPMTREVLLAKLRDPGTTWEETLELMAQLRKIDGRPTFEEWLAALPVVDDTEEVWPPR